MKRLTDTLEAFLELGGTRKEIILLIISGAALLLSIFHPVRLPFDAAWIAIILCGVPIILEAFIGLVTAFDIKADVLVSLALIASVCIGEDFAAGEVAFIMQLGGLLEDLTVAKARAGIEKLVKLTPRTARVLSSGGKKSIPAEEVKVGDRIRVLPGETVPVDGRILSGQTSVNQAVMTGESLPVDKAAGDDVSSGTVNQFGAFEMEAVKVGEDSSIQRMIRLVQSADAGKAKIVSLADRWATWVVIIALTAALLTWIFSGEVIRAVTILVVFCPCAMVLATPTAIMAAIGNATHHGFLIREGDALERLASVKRIAFDKTGTLTYGRPEVTAVRSLSSDWTEEQLFAFAAAAEQFSEHPLGKAVMRDFRAQKQTDKPASETSESLKSTKTLELLQADSFQMIPGQGVSARIEGKTILAGNQKMLKENCSSVPDTLFREADEYLEKGCTIIYLAADGTAAGFLALSDTVRPESAQTIAWLKTLGVQPVLLTGDHENAAHTIAKKLGIDDVQAGCLPEDKLTLIDMFQKNKEAVCMIGDGINDAPALKKADVGIAMGGVGSDIAVDAADIALVDDQVQELPHLLALSRRMMLTIKCNLSFSLGLNLIAIVLAITGILGPVAGALVHNAGSVVVIIHSAILLKWRKKIPSLKTVTAQPQ